MEEDIPSSNTLSSRKRSLDNESDEHDEHDEHDEYDEHDEHDEHDKHDEHELKKTHNISDMQKKGTFHLKTLIPSGAAGTIIGKGGETIAQLQKDTTAKVIMSKPNEFYPGTTERVILITGNVVAILDVLSFIMKKIIENPEVKILVPNSTAGMIIGKGGIYIKQIKEETGAYVQISQKDKENTLVERCITVNSRDIKNSRNACSMILKKIVEDPQSGTCLNVTYTHITGPVPNLNPTGSPLANSPSPVRQRGSNFGSGLSNHMTASSSLGNLLGSGVNLTLNFSTAFPNGDDGNLVVTSQILEYARNILHSSGFTNNANAEVCQAINTLLYYGIIDLGTNRA